MHVVRARFVLEEQTGVRCPGLLDEDPGRRGLAQDTYPRELLGN